MGHDRPLRSREAKSSAIPRVCWLRVNPASVLWRDPYMAHPDYPDELACGCVCAEHMEGDYQRPREREKASDIDQPDRTQRSRHADRGRLQVLPTVVNPVAAQVRTSEQSDDKRDTTAGGQPALGPLRDNSIMAYWSTHKDLSGKQVIVQRSADCMARED